MFLHVRLAIECKVKLFKYIQIFCENTNFTSSALVAYVQYLPNTLAFFLIRLYAMKCVTHVRKRIFCESKYMRLGNVYGLTQWMSFGRVEVHFFFRSEIFCLFSLVLLNFFLSQCFNIDLCSRVVKCMWNKWNAHTWKRISFIFVYLEQSVCQNWRKFLVFLFLFISAC